MNECKYDDNEIVNHGDYYSYRGQLYINQFPQMWATSHVAETGPEECENCAFYGSWNGVFIGYCMNCAKYIYEFQRGHGFIDHGEEVELDIPQLRAMETYLNGVNLDEIETAPNRDFYELSSDSDDDHYEQLLDNMKDHKKYRRSDEHCIKTTPVTDKSCDICAIGK